MSGKFSLLRAEKLKSIVKTDKLFTKGKSFRVFPFTVYYLKEENSCGNKFLVSVGKKLFRRAVDRNRLKRLVREAYRLNKGDFCALTQKENAFFNIAFVYKSKEMESFNVVEQAVKNSLNILVEKIMTKENISK